MAENGASVGAGKRNVVKTGGILGLLFAIIDLIIRVILMLIKEGVSLEHMIAFMRTQNVMLGIVASIFIICFSYAFVECYKSWQETQQKKISLAMNEERMNELKKTIADKEEEMRKFITDQTEETRKAIEVREEELKKMREQLAEQERIIAELRSELEQMQASVNEEPLLRKRKWGS